MTPPPLKASRAVIEAVLLVLPVGIGIGSGSGSDCGSSSSNSRNSSNSSGNSSNVSIGSIATTNNAAVTFQGLHRQENCVETHTVPFWLIRVRYIGRERLIPLHRFSQQTFNRHFETCLRGCCACIL